MNPYDVLGVRPNATDDEIAGAYRRLAKRYHPDLHPDDQTAAARMGEINRAYDEVKAMRRRGESPDPDMYERGPFDPMRQTRSYTYYYRKPARSPVAMILAVVVTFFLVRLLLSILLGGYAGSYYMNGYYPAQDAAPGYGYYQTFP